MEMEVVVVVAVEARGERKGVEMKTLLFFRKANILGNFFLLPLF